MSIAYEVFASLYENVNGSLINKESRECSGLDEQTLSNMMYGETLFETMQAIAENPEISKIAAKGGKFLDVGSGIGNVVIGVALLSNFFELSGIEIIKGTYQESVKKLQELKNILPNFNKKISFFNENALNFNIEKYDVIFANHPLKLESPARPILLEKFENCKIGTVFISAIGDLQSKTIVRFYKEKMQFSWGEATLRMYKKIY